MTSKLIACHGRLSCWIFFKSFISFWNNAFLTFYSFYEYCSLIATTLSFQSSGHFRKTTPLLGPEAQCLTDTGPKQHVTVVKSVDFCQYSLNAICNSQKRISNPVHSQEDECLFLSRPLLFSVTFGTRKLQKNLITENHFLYGSFTVYANICSFFFAELFSRALNISSPCLDTGFSVNMQPSMSQKDFFLQKNLSCFLWFWMWK